MSEVWARLCVTCKFQVEVFAFFKLGHDLYTCLSQSILELMNNMLNIDELIINEDLAFYIASVCRVDPAFDFSTLCI